MCTVSLRTHGSPHLLGLEETAPSRGLLVALLSLLLDALLFTDDVSLSPPPAHLFSKTTDKPAVKVKETKKYSQSAGSLALSLKKLFMPPNSTNSPTNALVQWVYGQL